MGSEWRAVCVCYSQTRFVTVSLAQITRHINTTAGSHRKRPITDRAIGGNDQSQRGVSPALAVSAGTV